MRNASLTGTRFLYRKLGLPSYVMGTIEMKLEQVEMNLLVCHSSVIMSSFGTNSSLSSAEDQGGAFKANRLFSRLYRQAYGTPSFVSNTKASYLAL